MSSFVSGPYRTPEQHLIDLDADPVLPYDWTVWEHMKGGMLEWDPNRVRLHLSEGQTTYRDSLDGKCRPIIAGLNLFEELRTQRPLNANVLDFLLERQHLIPADWKFARDGAFWSGPWFWGTIYCQRWSDGGVRWRAVRGMYWHQGVWHSHIHLLSFDWDGIQPAAMLIAERTQPALVLVE